MPDSNIFAAISTTEGRDFKINVSFPIPDIGSNYGFQMAEWYRSIAGVATAEDNSLAAIQVNSGGSSGLIKLPSLYKALGRVSVTVANGRFYVAYRGTNDGVYLVYTSDFDEWTDLGRVGSKYAKTSVSPAIGYFEDEDEDEAKLVLTGVGADKYIYYTVLDPDGKRDISWTKIPGTGTQSALAMTTYEANVTLFHTAYNNGAFFYQKYDSGKKEWAKLEKVVTPSISSGVSAVGISNGFCVSYKGAGESVQSKRMTGGKWSDEVPVFPYFKMLYQLGMCAARNPAGIHVSIPVKREESSAQYKRPASMSDKTIYISEKEAEEWDCKWQEKEQSKSMLGKFFCC